MPGNENPGIILIFIEYELNNPGLKLLQILKIFGYEQF